MAIDWQVIQTRMAFTLKKITEYYNNIQTKHIPNKPPRLRLTMSLSVFRLFLKIKNNQYINQTHKNKCFTWLYFTSISYIQKVA